MMQCPICRALLNGAEICRRCRAELKLVQDVERQGRELAGAAMHLLALGNTVEAQRLLRRACVVHATPEVRALKNAAPTPRPSGAAAGPRPGGDSAQ
jgi:hypothetical protein